MLYYITILMLFSHLVKHLTFANNSSILIVSTCMRAQTIVITIQESFLKATAACILN